MLRMRIGKGGDKLRREQAHVTGQADQIDVVRLEAGDHIGVVLGALAAFGDKKRRRQPKFFRGFESACLGDIRDDDGDLDVLEPPFADVFGDGEEVGAAAGEKDSEAKRRLFRFRIGSQFRQEDSFSALGFQFREPLNSFHFLRNLPSGVKTLFHSIAFAARLNRLRKNSDFEEILTNYSLGG